MRKWILFTLAALLLAVILFFYISFNGNFISKIVAKKMVETYVAETFEGQKAQLTDSDFNFKDGRYTFYYEMYNDTIRSHYTFTIGGSFIPTGKIYNYLDAQSMDETTTEAFQKAGQEFIEQQLTEHKISFSGTNYLVSVPKGLYDTDVVWQPEIDVKLMPSIMIDLVYEQQTKAQFLQQAKQIRQLFEEHRLTYDEVSISVYRKYDNSDGSKVGYAETYYESLYWTNFTPNTKELTIY